MKILKLIFILIFLIFILGCTKPDKENPVITLIEPVITPDNNIVSGIIVIKVRATDDIKVREVAFYVDNLCLAKVSTTPNNEYSCSWDTTKVDDGDHILIIKATDTSGKFSELQNIVNVQNPWQKIFGGGDLDKTVSIQQTSDGGYIVVGMTLTNSAGYTDIYLIKLDKKGNKQWDKTYGGVGYDEAVCVQETSDGNYITCGLTTTPPNNGKADFYIVKFDTNGIPMWGKKHGGSNDDLAFSIQQTSDGGYIVAGKTLSFGAGGSDAYIIKLDSNGNCTWSKTFGGLNYEDFMSVKQTNDGGYIAVGCTNSFGNGLYDVYVVKLDSDGNCTWSKTFGGIYEDWANSVELTDDGGYIIAGITVSFASGEADFYVIKLDSSGNLIWQKTYGGMKFEEAFSIRKTIDGGYIIAGYTDSFGSGYEDIYVVKLKSNGDYEWSKTFGGEGMDCAFDIEQTKDKGYILAGVTESFGIKGDAYIIKTDPKGNTASYPPIKGIPSFLKQRSKFTYNTIFEKTILGY